MTYDRKMEIAKEIAEFDVVAGLEFASFPIEQYPCAPESIGIIDLFKFSFTPQGYDYWYNINLKLVTRRVKKREEEEFKKKVHPDNLKLFIEKHKKNYVWSIRVKNPLSEFMFSPVILDIDVIDGTISLAEGISEFIPILPDKFVVIQEKRQDIFK